jgi:hypothetical protein
VTLRAAMHSREGVRAAEDAIRRGLRAWAVERESPVLHRRLRTIVFGGSPSDAGRRASTPGRLAEELDGDVTTVAEITSGWDAEIVWPLGHSHV